MDIAAWLQSLGLDRYAAAFRDNEINWAVLPKLTSDDLKDIGVIAVGHRRMLLEAIAALGVSAAISTVTAAVSEVSAPAEAERRQLTVMFCDLVGSTPLSTRFDPEDLREIVGAYHRCVADTVGRFGGFVAKYMGDGVLIYFGYPEAHEDDAERAARARLAVIDAIGRLANTRAAERSDWHHQRPCRRWRSDRHRRELARMPATSRSIRAISDRRPVRHDAE